MSVKVDARFGKQDSNLSQEIQHIFIHKSTEDVMNSHCWSVGYQTKMKNYCHWYWRQNSFSTSIYIFPRDFVNLRDFWIGWCFCLPLPLFLLLFLTHTQTYEILKSCTLNIRSLHDLMVSDLFLYDCWTFSWGIICEP